MFSSVMAKTVALTALRFVLSLGSGLFKHQKADSLVSFTKATRVEPICIIDQRAMALPYLHDTLQTVNSIFIGYYLQAVSLLVNVGNINVVKLLDSLNPNRDMAGAANAYLVDKMNKDSPSLLSLESYQFALPVPAETASMEDSGQARLNRTISENIDKAAGKIAGDMDTVIGQTTGKHGPHIHPQELKDAVNPATYDGGRLKNLAKNAQDTISNVQGGGASYKEIDVAKEATNLSVGKLVEVTISAGKDQKATFPIQVRLIATLMASSILTHILGDGSRDMSAKERFHAWRSGQLEFWRDLVLAQDLIDERRKALIKDDTGTYTEILKRRAGNAAAGIMTATPSIGNASNIVILTSQTAKELEHSIGGRLSDARTRNKVFNNTYIMLMVVIDPEWEQITIYHRGIALPTKLSVKELKVANKGSGPDVGEILKAYQLGSQVII